MDRFVEFIEGDVQLLGHGLDGTQSIRNTPMFPIPLIGNIVTGAESAGIFCIPQHGLDLRRRPNEILSFDPFRVRIRRGIKPSGRVGHLPENIIKHFRRDLAIGGLLGHLIGFQIGPGQEGIVVEHLLEMRNQPTLVGRVPREPSSDMIVESPGRHRIKRACDHL